MSQSSSFRAFIGIFTFGFLGSLMLFYYTWHSHEDPWSPYRNGFFKLPYRLNPTAPIKVLFWDGKHNHWSGLSSSNSDDPLEIPNYVGHTVNQEQCPIECQYTLDKSEVGIADAVGVTINYCINYIQGAF